MGISDGWNEWARIPNCTYLYGMVLFRSWLRWEWSIGKVRLKMCWYSCAMSMYRSTRAFLAAADVKVGPIGRPISLWSSAFIILTSPIIWTANRRQRKNLSPPKNPFSARIPDSGEILVLAWFALTGKVYIHKNFQNSVWNMKMVVENVYGKVTVAYAGSYQTWWYSLYWS